MENINITKIQYEIMLNTIGFSRELLNNNEFKMKKNIFQQNKNIIDTDWITLIKLGFGEELNTVNRHINYRITKKGIEHIAEKEGIKVDFNNFFVECSNCIYFECNNNEEPCLNCSQDYDKYKER